MAAAAGAQGTGARYRPRNPEQSRTRQAVLGAGWAAGLPGGRGLPGPLDETGIVETSGCACGGAVPVGNALVLSPDARTDGGKRTSSTVGRNRGPHGGADVSQRCHE